MTARVDGMIAHSLMLHVVENEDCSTTPIKASASGAFNPTNKTKTQLEIIDWTYHWKNDMDYHVSAA